MVIKVIVTLIIFPEQLLLGYFIISSISMRRPKLFVWGTAIYTMLIYIVSMWVLPEQKSILDIISMASYIALAAYMSTGEKKRTLLCVCVYILALILAEASATVIFLCTMNLHGRTVVDVAMNTIWGAVSIRALFMMIFALYLTIAQRFLQKHLRFYGTGQRKTLFLMIPVSQLITLDLLMPIAQDSKERHTILLLCVAAGIGVIADISYFRTLSAIEHQDMLEKQVKLSEQELNNQMNYYLQMENNINHINQIRHDLNNQLQTAYYLLDHSKTEEARAQLDELKNQIGSHLSTVYCANMVVDAVLVEKAAICREAGIEAQIEMDLPAHLEISGAHLCSLFANLLDNAISGCISSEKEEKRLQIRAAIRNEYLVVYCANTFSEQPAKVKHQTVDALPEHGLGMGILQNIAKQYDGDITIEKQNGLYQATILLRAGKIL